MPESYIEPLTDRQQCYTCHMTVTGKKKLFKCAGCHRITYCGVECQKEDRTRHQWNCVPVMVTEIPGKGRGLVAARDIKMGELIFVDKPVIKVNSNEEPMVILESLRKQIDKLPSEAKRQFNLLTVLPRYQDDDDDSDQDENMLNFAKLVSNSSGLRDGMDGLGFCYLNTVLINHSCAPNVSKGPLRPDEEHKQEVRAIKDIKRGEEVTSCYLVEIDGYLWSHGFDKQRRMKRIQERFGFACKCCVCSGIVPGQEDIMKELLKLHLDLNPNMTPSSDWKMISKNFDKIAELTNELYTGCVEELKLVALQNLASVAHLARDEDLLAKAMDNYNQLVEDTKLEYVRLAYEELEGRLTSWNVQLKSKKKPNQEEIELFSPEVEFAQILCEFKI